MRQKKHFRFTPSVLLNKAAIFGLTITSILLLSPLLKSKSIVFCANTISCNKSFEFEVDNNLSGIFQNQSVVVPPIDLLNQSLDNRVFGVATASGEKHIYVDLETQTLYAYQGTDLYMKSFISSGKWYPTPTGEFSIWAKVRSTRMTGGSGVDYYDLPNVPFVMFFANDAIAKSRGFGFHGAYWHNNFGHPMSHGCINMRQIDAQQLYEWADPLTTSNTIYTSKENPGTKVTIYYSSTK